MWPHVVEALVDFGDAGVIPRLEMLLNDKTHDWPEDNHGPMLRVCDLAKATISPARGIIGGKRFFRAADRRTKSDRMDHVGTEIEELMAFLS